MWRKSLRNLRSFRLISRVKGYTYYRSNLRDKVKRGDGKWLFINTRSFWSKPTIRRSIISTNQKQKHHIPESIVVRDADMKSRLPRITRFRHKTITNIKPLLRQFAGG